MGRRFDFAQQARQHAAGGERAAIPREASRQLHASAALLPARARLAPSDIRMRSRACAASPRRRAHRRFRSPPAAPPAPRRTHNRLGIAGLRLLATTRHGAHAVERKSNRSAQRAPTSASRSMAQGRVQHQKQARAAVEGVIRFRHGFMREAHCRTSLTTPITCFHGRVTALRNIFPAV